MKLNDTIKFKSHLSELNGLAHEMRVLAFRGAEVKVSWPNYRGAQHITWVPLTHLQKHYSVSKGQN
jgi:hypothetical protein